MRIDKVLQKHKGTLSFEIFPPKGEFNEETVYGLLRDLAPLDPAFISVTYSAGGSSNGKFTEEIAKITERDFGIPSVAHITCINSSKETVENTIESFAKSGIENVLALRGDKVEGCKGDFAHATDIMPLIAKKGFCFGGACYPEGHPSSDTLKNDVQFVKMKEDLGAKFFISQLCFDNKYFFDFFDQINHAGISAPISAGIMPIMGKTQINRMIYMCATSLPGQIIRILNKYENDPEGLLEAGLDYATNQIVELYKEGVDDIHFYTMNRPNVAKGLCERLSALGYGK